LDGLPYRTGDRSAGISRIKIIEMSTTESEIQKTEKKQKLFWLEKLGMRTHRRFWTSDKLLSLFAFLISVGTFVTFAYQTYLIRKQQYASVMPYLMINYSTDNSKKFISVNVTNNGIGPAFIKDIKVHYNDTIIDGDPFLFAIHTLRPDTMSNFSVSSTNIYKGYVIPAGEILATVSSHNAATGEILMETFVEKNNAIVEITYSSVYDETWVIKGTGSIPEKLE